MNSVIKNEYINKFGAIPSGPLDPSPYSDEFQNLLLRAVKENRRIIVIGPSAFSLDGERYMLDGDTMPEGYEPR